VFFDNEVVSLTGRIYSIRASGKSLIFIDLDGDSAKVQIMASAEHYVGKAFEELQQTLRRGDIIGVEGSPGRSKPGELTVRATKIVTLSYCMHMLPKPEVGSTGLTMNKDTRYR